METKLLSRRSGQSAVEFTFLLLFVLLIATLVVVLLQQNLDREIERLDRQIVQEFRNVWYEEIEQATGSTQGYSREFEVNSNPRGFPVISRFGDAQDNVTDELVISYKGYEHLFFLPAEVDYSGVGQNVSLSDGVKVSRRCRNECKIFLFEDGRAPGYRENLLNFGGAGVDSMNALTGRSQRLFASGQDKVSIVNVSDPSNVSRLSTGTMEAGKQFGRITSHGHIVAAPRTAGTEIDLVNITDPQSPTETGLDTIDSFSGSEKPTVLEFDYPYGYAVTQGSFHVFSLSNWSNVQEIDDAPNSVGGVDAAYDPRGYVFTAAGDADVIGVYDVTNRFNVSLRSKIDVLPQSNVQTVKYRGEHLFAVEEDHAAIYDVSNVSNPSRTEITSLNNGEDGVFWRDYWFVAEDSGYTIIDVGEPSNYEIVEENAGFNDLIGIYADHDAVYLGFEAGPIISYS